jgi:hypothetical protein
MFEEKHLVVDLVDILEETFGIFKFYRHFNLDSHRSNHLRPTLCFMHLKSGGDRSLWVNGHLNGREGHLHRQEFLQGRDGH